MTQLLYKEHHKKCSTFKSYIQSCVLFCSTLPLFNYFYPYILQASNLITTDYALEKSNINKTPPLWKSDELLQWETQLFQKLLTLKHQHLDPNGYYIIWSLIYLFWKEFLSIIIFKISHSMLGLFSAWQMVSLVKCHEGGHIQYSAISIAIRIIILELSLIFLNAHVTFWENRIKLRIEGILSMLLSHCLLLSNNSSSWNPMNHKQSSDFECELKKNVLKTGVQPTTPNMFNLLTCDIPYTVAFIWHSLDLIIFPIASVLSLRVLYAQIGTASISGCIVLILIMVTVFLLELQTAFLKRSYLNHRDNRLLRTYETFTKARTLQMIGWEHIAINHIEEARHKEMAIRKIRMFLFGIASGLSYSAESWVKIAVFVTYAILQLKHQQLLFLTPSKALPAALIITKLSRPLTKFAFLANSLIECSISLRRYQTILTPLLSSIIYTHSTFSLTPEKKALNQMLISSKDDATVLEQEILPLLSYSHHQQHTVSKHHCPEYFQFSNAIFTWKFNSEQQQHNTTEFFLSVKQLQISKGDCCLIIGSPGSGKSSFILALLGEMNCIHGQCILPNVVSHLYLQSDHYDAPSNTQQHLLNSIGLATQVPWIPKGTVRSIILFGRPYIKERYHRVIDICELYDDFNYWGNDKDMRWVSEGGFNLSGGQRARIALARALYHCPLSPIDQIDMNTTVCLLDDIFASIDPIVGLGILKKLVCLNGILCNAATVLTIGVEHSSFYLTELNKQQDALGITLNIMEIKSGVLSHSTNFSNTQLLEIKEEPPVIMPGSTRTLELTNTICYTHDILEQYDVTHLEENNVSINSKKTSLNQPIELNSTHHFKHSTVNYLLLDADDSMGQYICQETYKWYGKRVGFLCLFILFIFIILIEFSVIFSTFWLSYWSLFSTNDSLNHSFICSSFFIFIILLCIVGLCVPIMYSIQIWACLKAAQTIHTELLNKLISLQYCIYDYLSIGTIMNRLSTDTHTVDSNALYAICVFITSITTCCFTALALIIATPWSFLLMPLIAWFMYHVIYKLYQSSACNIQKHKLSCISPLCEHFSEVMNGLIIIRAFRAESYYLRQNIILTTHVMQAQFLQHGCQAYVGIRMELLSFPLTILNSVIPSLLAILGLGFIADNIVSFFTSYTHLKNKPSPILGSLAGLGIILASSLPRVIRDLVYSSAELEVNMCSVERLRQLSLISAINDKTDDVVIHSFNNNVKNDYSIPTNYIIEWNCVTIHYPLPQLQHKHKQLPSIHTPVCSMSLKSFYPSLIHFTATIQPGQHIGIVGRTGAGKSTLLLSVLNLLPLTEGMILFDGIPIQTIHPTLRQQKIGVLPYDLFIINGWTIRQFLDPNDEFDDIALYSVIKKLHVMDFFNTLPNCLETRIYKNNYLSNIQQGNNVSNCLSIQNKIYNTHSDHCFLSESQLRWLSLARLSLYADRYRLIVIDEPPIEEYTLPKNTTTLLKDSKNNIMPEDQNNILHILPGIFRELFPYCAIMIATHSVSTLRYCDDVWVMSNGRLVKNVSSSSIRTQHDLFELLSLTTS